MSHTYCTVYHSSTLLVNTQRASYLTDTILTLAWCGAMKAVFVVSGENLVKSTQRSLRLLLSPTLFICLVILFLGSYSCLPVISRSWFRGQHENKCHSWATIDSIRYSCLATYTSNASKLSPWRHTTLMSTNCHRQKRSPHLSLLEKATVTFSSTCFCCSYPRSS